MKKIALLSVAILLLTACDAQSTESTPYQSSNTKQSTYDSTTSKPSSKNSSINSETSSLTTSESTPIVATPTLLTDNVFVSYNKSKYEKITSAKCYSVDFQPITEDFVSGLFNDKPEISDDGYGNTFFKTENEHGQLTHRPTSGIYSLTYRTDQGDKFDTAVYQHYTDYSLKTEFDFISRENIKNVLNDKLKAIIPTGITLSAYAVNKEAYAGNIAAIVGDSIGDDSKNNIISEIEWGEADDYYYIIAEQLVDNIPIFSGTTGDIDTGTSTSGTSIKVIYTKNGIEYLGVTAPYIVKGEVSPEGNFISVEKAEELLKNKYDEFLISENVEYTGVRLVYIPLHSADGLILTPVWEFSNDGEGLVTYFNAYTGDEII